MKRALFAVALMLVMIASVSGDVTIVSTTVGKGLGMSGEMPSKTYLKGLKMRVDGVRGDTTNTTIFDVENQKMYVFDSKKKEADVWDMAVFAAELSKSVAPEGMKASIKPNGTTKQIAGRTASGYDVELSVPGMLGGEKGMKMTALLTGVAWIVKGAPGSAEYAAFYRAAADKGWIFSDPRAAKGSPGQAKAIAEMHREFANIGGVPYETDINIKMAGEGPMAGMMSRMGGFTMTSTTTSVETGAVADDMFAPPAGYKLNARK
jgi:hypothetical protein